MKATKNKYQKITFGQTRYKFGVIVTQTGDVRGAMRIEKENGYIKWFDAQKKEASTLRIMDTFELISDGFYLTKYHYIPLIYAWYLKFYGRMKARLVANGKVTIGLPESEVWSGFLNTETVCTAILLAMLKHIKVLAADISPAYLMENTKEMMHSTLGP